jgi:hypothetical protein
MRRTLSLAVAVSLSVLVLPAVAQDDGGNVAVLHCIDVKGGTQGPFEEGMKKHMAWHKEKKDTWGWDMWNVITGPDSGQYCAGSGGHKWEDLDSPTVSHEEDDARAGADFGDYIAHHEMTLWTRLADVSRPADEPAPMSTVGFFYINFGMGEDFNDLIGQFHKAIEKTEMPWRYNWYALANGGKGGTYALVLPRANFAAMNPSGKPFNEMLADAYGKAAANALLERWRAVVKGTRNHLTQARPDLSYIPEP